MLRLADDRVAGTGHGLVPGNDQTLVRRDLADRLARISKGLEKLIHGRERDFMALGSAVMDFSERSRTLSDKAARLSGTLSEGGMTGSLEEIAVRMKEVLSMCRLGCSTRCLEEIEQLREGVVSLSGQFGGFRKIIRTLQMLGISTRIESARLGDLGRKFMTLSDQVEKLALKIVEDVATIQARTKRLEGVVEEVKSKARVMMSEQSRCGAGIQGEIEGNVEALGRMTGNADAVSVRLAEKTSRIAEHVSAIVSSVQFHDIVRQQVEHITQSIQDIVHEVRDTTGEDSQNHAMVLGWVRDLCRLNDAQLRNASTRFEDAVHKIRQSFVDIGEASLDTVGEVDSLLRDDQAKGGDMLQTLRDNTEKVVALLGHFGSSMRGIAGLMEDLGSNVAEMGVFLESIEDVGAEIELIALNATINSAHTGDQGRALSVLAQAIRQLSLQARQDTASFSGTLRDVTRYAEVLKGQAAGMASTQDLERIAGGQREILARLAATSRTFDGQLREVQSEGLRLGQSLKDYAGSIDFHQDICPKLEEAAGGLERIAATASSEAGEGVHERPERLENLLSRYTMEMERAIYQNTLGTAGDAGKPPVQTSQAGADGGAETWDNVELF